jgi:hypothetical protein
MVEIEKDIKSAQETDTEAPDMSLKLLMEQIHFSIDEMQDLVDAVVR